MFALTFDKARTKTKSEKKPLFHGLVYDCVGINKDRNIVNKLETITNLRKIRPNLIFLLIEENFDFYYQKAKELEGKLNTTVKIIQYPGNRKEKELFLAGVIADLLNPKTQTKFLRDYIDKPKLLKGKWKFLIFLRKDFKNLPPLEDKKNTTTKGRIVFF